MHGMFMIKRKEQSPEELLKNKIVMIYKKTALSSNVQNAEYIIKKGPRSIKVKVLNFKENPKELKLKITVMYPDEKKLDELALMVANEIQSQIIKKINIF